MDQENGRSPSLPLLPPGHPIDTIKNVYRNILLKIFQNALG